MSCSNVTAPNSLRQVFILTRHGARTPIRMFPNWPKVWETFEMDSRSNRTFLTTSTDKEKSGWGILTTVGEHQLLEMGQAFRRDYASRLQLDLNVSPMSPMPEEIVVLASETQRTIYSARSFLSGLYGFEVPLSWVQVLYKANDTLLRQYKHNPKVKQLQQQNRESDDWKRKEEESAPLRQTLSQLLGMEIGLRHMTSVSTLFQCHLTHEVPLPEFVTPELMAETHRYADFVWRMKYHGKELTLLSAGNLFKEIIYTMKRTVKALRSNPSTSPAKLHSRTPRCYLFSAHDSTVLALLSVMGVARIRAPVFASNIIFELHQLPSEETQCGCETSNNHVCTAARPQSYRYEVRIFYDGVPLAVRRCNSRCRLDIFDLIWEDAVHGQNPDMILDDDTTEYIAISKPAYTPEDYIPVLEVGTAPAVTLLHEHEQRAAAAAASASASAATVSV